MENMNSGTQCRDSFMETYQNYGGMQPRNRSATYEVEYQKYILKRHSLTDICVNALTKTAKRRREHQEQRISNHWSDSKFLTRTTTSLILSTWVNKDSLMTSGREHVCIRRSSTQCKHSWVKYCRNTKQNSVWSHNLIVAKSSVASLLTFAAKVRLCLGRDAIKLFYQIALKEVSKYMCNAYSFWAASFNEAQEASSIRHIRTKTTRCQALISSEGTHSPYV